MSSTLSVARRRLIREMGARLAEYHTITGLATGSVTIGSLANTNVPTNKYQNNIIFRSEASTAADYIRYAGAFTVASGLLAHTGAVYSDVTPGTEVGELWYDPEIDPYTMIQPMFVDALDELKTICHVPLAHGPLDYDMQASGITNWPDGGTGTTPAKQTTAAEVWDGARSLVVTDSGSGLGYTESALNRAGRGKQLNVFAVPKVDTGTGRLVVLDGSSNTLATINTTEEDWVLMKKQVMLGSTGEQWRLRLQSVGVADSVDWQAAWVVKPDQWYFDAPSWLSDKMRAVGVSVGREMVSAGETDTYLAGSIEYVSLDEGIHFRFARANADANPYRIFMLPAGQSLMDEPLFIDIACPYTAPYGVTAAFAVDADTTTCPLDLLTVQMKIEMGRRWPSKFPDLAPAPDGSAHKGLQRQKGELMRRERAYSPPPAQSGWAGMFRGPR